MKVLVISYLSITIMLAKISELVQNKLQLMDNK